MLLRKTDSLPDDRKVWEYQIKFDGYRSIAFKTGGKVYLRSRNDHDFVGRYPNIVKGLCGLPDETVIDGEVVALDELGRPSFNALQNYGSSNSPLLYYVFDVMVLSGVDVMREPLWRRRKVLEERVLPNLTEPVRYLSELEADLPDLVNAVKKHGLEGLSRNGEIADMSRGCGVARGERCGSTRGRSS
jgi:bifunctional non-homologous end joining protein LigD